MALTDRYKKQADKVAERRAQLAYERSQVIADDIIKSDQFQLALEAGLDNLTGAIDTILRKSCEAIFDPVADFLDTVRAKGLPESYIRKWVHKLYNFISNDEGSDLGYEQMLEFVAEYMISHPELYNLVKDADGAGVRDSLDEGVGVPGIN